MASDRFFIAPYDSNSGLQKNVRPWLIPDQAWAELTNAYVFRGRTRKRFGSRWLGNTQLESRFRIAVGTLAAPVSPVPGASGSLGQAFSIADVFFTVNNATPAPQNLLIANGSATTKTFDVATGAFVFNAVLDSLGVAVPLGTTIYFYPALPVMGLLTYEISTTNNEKIIGFDTTYAYEFTTGTGWSRISAETAPGDASWSGSDSQFFWGTTWSGANAADRIFFVTNFNENEPNFLRYYDGTQWTSFRPAISASEFLNSCRLFVVFKNRLLVFNTWEGAASPGINYQNRVRWSQIGSPLDMNAWRQDIPGRGSGLDAPTMEAIITAEFIKDRLIIYFERSTYELVYTGNQIYPFVWQKINTELGAESTFSIVPFDRVAIGIGNVGIHACNGSNVDRIDNEIPDEVFEIHNSDGGVDRVYGIRDYWTELVYWAFPDVDADSDFPYPHRVLVYNYKTGTWAFNIDSITAFGYIQLQTGVTWDSLTVTWDDDVSWNSGSNQAQFLRVIAGNQQGYTFIIDPDTPTNAPVLQITDISPSGMLITITAINHNLRTGEFVYFKDIQGTNTIEDLNQLIFKVLVIDKDTFTINTSENITGTYAGGGVIARVSKPILRTKEFNFYAKEGRNAMVNKVDFLVDATRVGQVLVNFYVSTSTRPLVQDSDQSGTRSLLGTSALDTFPYPLIPFESDTERIWHPVYFQANGNVIQFEITMSDEQMTQIEVDDDTGEILAPSFEDFQLHAMCIYAKPTSYGMRGY